MQETGVPAVDVLAAWALAIAAIATVVGLAWRAARRVLAAARRVEELVDDWQGTEERPGVPGRPGVMARLGAVEERLGGLDARLAAVEHELHPNEGGSLRDALDRVDRRTRWLCPDEPSPADEG